MKPELIKNKLGTFLFQNKGIKKVFEVKSMFDDTTTIFEDKTGKPIKITNNKQAKLF